MKRLFCGGTAVVIVLAVMLFLPASGRLLLPVAGMPETMGSDEPVIPETLPPETTASETEITPETRVYLPVTVHVDEIFLTEVTDREMPRTTKTTTVAETTKATTAKETTTAPTTQKPKETTWDTSKWPQVDPSAERKIDPNKPMVCLTFDDGPSRATKTILDVLDKYQSRATFFVLGVLVPGNEALVRRMVADGHEIGNHTYNHVSLSSVSTKEILSQIEKTNLAVYKASGYEPSMFRPPYNNFTESILKIIPMPIVCWSIDPRDWQKTDPDAIVRASLKGIRDGDIIVLHDSRTATGNAMKILVPELISRGYQVVTVSEMFEAKGIKLKDGIRYRRGY